MIPRSINKYGSLGPQILFIKFENICSVRNCNFTKYGHEKYIKEFFSGYKSFIAV